MGVAVLSFFAIFLLIASGGLLIFYRETIQARIAAAINPQVKQKSLKIKLQDTGNLLGGMVEHLERVVPTERGGGLRCSAAPDQCRFPQKTAR